MHFQTFSQLKIDIFSRTLLEHLKGVITFAIILNSNHQLAHITKKERNLFCKNYFIYSLKLVQSVLLKPV